MTQTIRFCLPSLLSLLLFCPTLNAEDVRLRERAVQLMERANAASLLAGFRDYEQVVSFTFLITLLKRLIPIGRRAMAQAPHVRCER